MFHAGHQLARFFPQSMAKSTVCRSLSESRQKTGRLYNDCRVTLDIGCGKRKIEANSIGIDRSSDSVADVLWDLDEYPWPLESNTFRTIHMSHIIEHFDDAIKAMAEVHRVALPDADVFITTPHFSSHNSYVDPTHRRHLATTSFEYFTGHGFSTFSGAPFRFTVVEVGLTFGGNIILDNLGKMISRKSLKWYERHAAWVFPAADIQCHLRAIK